MGASPGFTGISFHGDETCMQRTDRASFQPHPAILVTMSLLLAVAPARAAEGTSASDASAAQAILDQVGDLEGEKLWSAVSRLEALGPDALPVLQKSLGRGAEKAKLAAAKTILRIGDADAKSGAVEALKDLIRGPAAKETRVAAIEIAGSEADPEEVLEFLEKMLDETQDPVLSIPLARTLWDLDRVVKGRERLIQLLGSRDREVKESAALALAEIDYFEGDVRDVLRSLKREPSARGRRAADLDRIFQLSRQLDRGLSSGEVAPEGADLAKLLKVKEGRIRELEDRLDRSVSSGRASSPRTGADALLEEVILQIQKSYVDESRTDRQILLLNALRGMVRSLDDFSSFMDVEDTKTFRESMAGEYPGIGAHVNKTADGPLEILKPIYGGPAYKAGILTGDRVIEVDGLRTDELQVEEATEKIRGMNGTTVTLKVIRRGWDAPRDFVIERRPVEVPSVYTELLPGKIGFLSLHQFGDRAADEFVHGLEELEKTGMAGLIIDLRNNPGGLLEAAVKITDQFVKGELPIVTQKGRGRARSSEEHATHADEFTRGDYPIMVLVNGRSASASEIVSGALQDFGRATLVGKRTFGKGSVQRLIPLSNEAKNVLGGEGQLRLTVQYYFLPLGRCIHTIRDKNGVVVEQGGVQPDIEVEAEKIAAWRAEEREKIRGSAAVVEYVDKHWNEITKLFTDGDDHDTTRYPEFDELYKAVDTPAPKDDLRYVLRFHIRRRLEDARGKEFACDIQEDGQLRRAILELLKKLGEKPEDYPRYASLVEKEPEEKK
jgi:carboxyl-terminal processing protease